MENTKNMETSLRDFIRVLFRHKMVFALFFIVVIPSIYIKQELQSPISVATVTMQVKGVKLSDVAYYKGLAIGSPEYIASTQSALMNTPVIIERVVKALKLYERPLDYGEMIVASNIKKLFIKRDIRNFKLYLEDMSPEQRKEILYNHAVEDLSGKIKAQGIPDTELFTISVQDYNPGVAPIIANSLSRSFVIFDLEQQIAELTLKYGEKHSTVAQLQAHIEELYKTLDGGILPFIKAMGPASVKIIQQAEGSSLIEKTNKMGGLVLAFLISLFGSIGSAFTLDYLSQTINSQRDVENYIGIPFLGIIPVVKSSATDKLNKFYQKISDRLDLFRKDRDCKAILFVNVEATEDCASIIKNIGFCLSRNNFHYKVLIIDANLKVASVSKIINVENTPGLANVLEEKIMLEDIIQNINDNVDVISAGQLDGNPFKLLNSSKMKNVIDKAKEIYDVIVISSADLKDSNDAVILSSYADSLILVINEGKVRRQVVNIAIAPFENKKIDFIGAILNNYRMVIPEAIYKRI